MEPQETLEQQLETDLVVISDDDDLEPLSLEYDDDDIGYTDEPVAAQLEPDYPDGRVEQ